MKPRRLAIAQMACRRLPPIASQRLRDVIYPLRLGVRDAFECTVPAVTGSNLRGTTRDYHFHRFSVHGYFDFRNVIIARALVPPGGTIVEVGANVGTETVCFSDIVGPTGVVHAFEPLPTNVASLKSASQLASYGNISVHPLALSDHDGCEQFVCPPQTYSGIGHLREPGENAQDVLRVDVSRLDSLIDDFGECQLIVIDIEGEEPRFLKGASDYLRVFQPAVILEASAKTLTRTGSSTTALRSLMERLGYGVFKIDRFGLRDVDESPPLRRENWLCLLERDISLVRRISRGILMSLTLPCVRGLNPLSITH